jgi:hypothetical protein
VKNVLKTLEVLTKSDAIIVKFLGKPVYTVAEVNATSR